MVGVFLMSVVAGIIGNMLYDGIKVIARRRSDTSQKA